MAERGRSSSLHRRPATLVVLALLALPWAWLGCGGTVIDDAKTDVPAELSIGGRTFRFVRDGEDLWIATTLAAEDWTEAKEGRFQERFPFRARLPFAAVGQPREPGRAPYRRAARADRSRRGGP